METMKVDEYLAAAKEHNATFQTEDFSDVSFDIDGDVLLCEHGRFSPRALGNFARSLSVPKGLLVDLTTPLAKNLIRERMIGKQIKNFRFGRFKDADDVELISFVQPAIEQYIDPVKVIEALLSKIRVLFGHPVYDDSCRILTEEVEFSDPQGHDMFAGLDTRLWPTGVSPTTFEQIAYRVICGNGMIARQHTTPRIVKLADFDGSVLGVVAKELGGHVREYADKMIDFMGAAEEKTLDVGPEEVIDSLDNSNRVPGTIIKFARIHAEQIVEDRTIFRDRGLDRLSTLWDYVNLFTMTANMKLSGLNSRVKAEAGTIRWAHDVLSPSLN